MFYTVYLYGVVYISWIASFTSSVKSFLYDCVGGGGGGRMGVCVCVCVCFVLCLLYVVCIVYILCCYCIHVFV